MKMYGPYNKTCVLYCITFPQDELLDLPLADMMFFICHHRM